jgi:putative redox protein
MDKHVSVRWTGEMDFEGSDAGGGDVSMSPTDAGFSPAALVLAALAGCTGMDAVSVMTKKRVGFDSYRVEVSGEQRKEHPRAFTAIVVEHVVTGKTIPDKAVARAIELSARKYCTVGATLATGDTTINHRMRIIDDAGERTCDCITIGPAGRGLASKEGA